MMYDFESSLEVFKALSNPHRLRILAELANGKQTITDLSRTLQMSPPLVFLHLRKLVKAGLVREEYRKTIIREGLPPLNKLYYEIDDFEFVVNTKKILEVVKNEFCT
jgi:DNA-binding transcriptional ArsR family regulator